MTVRASPSEPPRAAENALRHALEERRDQTERAQLKALVNDDTTKPSDIDLAAVTSA